MNIGFYGHSNCAYRSPDSFLDLVASNFRGDIVNIGCKQGSEERILFELKKTRNLDIAIIFHSQLGSLFIPNSDRDVNVNSLTFERAEDLFLNDHLDVSFTENNSPKFKQLFEDNENLFSSFDTYRKYFYHQDLTLNRYYGALIQIDQFLSYKNIKAIHVLDKKCPIPVWFKFTSGYVDYSIMEIADKCKAQKPFFVNCISKEGNKMIADKLISIVNTL